MEPSDKLISPPAEHPPRRKRHQVVRACDWCRKHRVKCDSSSPCSNCRKRGGPCSNDQIKAASLPHAYREIERLRRQVAELEGELAQEREQTRKYTPDSIRQKASASRSPGELGLAADPECASDRGDVQSFWGGIHIRTARAAHETWYGPSSLFYFIGRVTEFLEATLKQRHDSTERTLPKNPESSLIEVNLNSGGRSLSGAQAPAGAAASAPDGEFLSPTQEEYFLELFWQAYHTSLFPILDETEFKKHYRSLWTTSDNVRKPSALVDIVMALCMQYGISMMPATSQKGIVGNSDATIAGRSYYRRCQMLLAYELESPTIATFQCYLLSCIYLCCGSFQNMADSACALAVRTAHMLGLHLEPPSSMPVKGKEMRRRLWWSLYALDSKIGIKLGRPFLVYRSDAEPRPADDGNEVAMKSGSHFAPLGKNVTWLSFSAQNTKLLIAARKAHVAFYSKQLDVPSGKTVWEYPHALDTLAETLQPYAKGMQKWAQDLPDALKTKRQDNGVPLSTDGSALEIEQFAPLWLQRQRLLLELMYHNLSANLYRPFISFPPFPDSKSSSAEQMVTRCALHAITLTKIMHQVLSSTTILAGWHEAFQWQWNAATTLLGFVFAYPQSTSTTSLARDMLDLSVVVFDIFGESFAVARSAAGIVRDLRAKTSLVFGQTQSQPEAGWSSGGIGNGAINQSGQPLPLDNPTGMKLVDNVLNFNSDDLMAASMQDVFQMTLDVEQWSNFDMLWPNNADGILSEPMMQQYS